VTAYSAWTSAVVEPAPVNVTLPSVSGTAQVGDSASAAIGSWDNMGGHDATFSLTYYRETAPASGVYAATSVTGPEGTEYPFTEADIGLRLKVRVFATNDS
jgi:hypothetical protein